MSLNILVVEDSDIVREMMIKVIRMCKIAIGKIFEAANGLEGLAIISDNWIDLVITDVNMPRMGGVEMIDNLRMMPENNDLPVIIVTGDCSECGKFEENSRKSFIHKPFSMKEIKETIINLTGVCCEPSS